MNQLKNWQIVESEFPNTKYAHKETVFTIGNGYFSSRGSFEEGYPDETATTFVHGIFNDVPVFGTELVNFPCWFSLRIVLDNEVFRLDKGKILFYERNLNMETGLLSRQVRWESPRGRQLSISFVRYMDMANIHHANLRFTMGDFNFEGKVQIQSSIPGVVSNDAYRHWCHLEQGRIDDSGCYLAMVTSETHHKAAMAQHLLIESKGKIAPEYWNPQWMPTLIYELSIQPGDHINGSKDVMAYTNRECEDPISYAINGLKEIVDEDPERVLDRHNQVWENLWDRSNVTIEGDDRVDLSLRFNLFQILIAAPRHDDWVSIGAKTLSGYGYRGHVFWDTEIFVLPFLTYTQPEIARNLLLYRYHTLAGAREKAAENGFKGAMFAWESAATGEEVTPTWVMGSEGELIRIWCGDIEQHITADVAYGVRQYWQATGDDAFMRDFGAEIVLSGAQFYASRLLWSAETETYHIRDVIGPDEYHEHVDDNAMTNLMAAWALDFATEVAAWLKNQDANKYHALEKELSLTEREIQAWREMSKKVAVNIRPDGIIEQFNGYFDLAYVDQASLEPRDQSLQSLFGIQGVQQYQFIKQPDVVMALFLLRDRFTRRMILQNLAYYSPRTDLSLGSSLGPSIQALMQARYADVDAAYDLFIKTLMTDLENNRGNAPEGIHAASAGAVWQVLFYGILGFNVKGGTPISTPRLPDGWQRVKMKITWKNETIVFDIF